MLNLLTTFLLIPTLEKVTVSVPYPVSFEEVASDLLVSNMSRANVVFYELLDPNTGQCCHFNVNTEVHHSKHCAIGECATKEWLQAYCSEPAGPLNQHQQQLGIDTYA